MVLLGGPWFGWAEESQAAKLSPERWESSIARFEQQDQQTPPPRHANLFVGSSSIRLWKLETAFPGYKCINRGFGGSLLSDVVHFVPRIVYPYEPRVIVLYAGDNDLAVGRTADQVAADYRRFVQCVQSKLPETKIVWITIKPSPKRWALREEAQRANLLVRQIIQQGTKQIEVDIWPALLTADGVPDPTLYQTDQLHLSPAGYARWNERVRPHLVSQHADPISEHAPLRTGFTAGFTSYQNMSVRSDWWMQITSPAQPIPFEKSTIPEESL